MSMRGGNGAEEDEKPAPAAPQEPRESALLWADKVLALEKELKIADESWRNVVDAVVKERDELKQELERRTQDIVKLTDQTISLTSELTSALAAIGHLRSAAKNLHGVIDRGFGYQATAYDELKEALAVTGGYEGKK